MKKIQTRCLALVMAIVLPLSSFAQSSNCDVIAQAAKVGRDQATTRAGSIEKTIQGQVERSRNCLEAFGDVASRQALVLGGFNLAPLRNSLMDKTCTIIQREIREAIPPVPAGLQSVINQQQRLGSQTLSLPGQSTAPRSPSQAGTSVLDRVACTLSGKC